MKTVILKTLTLALCGVFAAGIAPIALAATTADTGSTSSAYTALAAKARAAGQMQTALFFQEQAMAQSISQPAVFGPAAGRYWQSINQAQDWSRAFDFFARLKAEHPDDPDVLANYGNAIGGLMGSLAPKYGNELPSTFFSSLNSKAMKAYAHALSIQPDNFTALLGRSIYLSYTPGGMAKAEAGSTYPCAAQEPSALSVRSGLPAVVVGAETQRSAQASQEGAATGQGQAGCGCLFAQVARRRLIR